jgi:hypothetical protein
MKIDVTSEDLTLINQYTRRELGKDEVYAFSFVLCDNDVDKDFEYFTIESLLELKKLFVGKTGFFCNSRNESNQSARIFDCKFEEVEGKKTTTGINYFRLKAKAYIVKSESNKDIVEKLNQGVINKVTVSCAVRRKVCSICGNEVDFCSHLPGNKYEEKWCYAKLVGIYDAYKFNIATDINSCKECLHYDVCLTFCTENTLKNRGVCKRFKNKSEYVKCERGEWKFACIYKHKKLYRCSCCDHVYPIYKNTRFCQHCGRKMRKENKNES